MAAMHDLRIRDARPEDLGAIRALTLEAYSQYATIMAPTAWAGLDRAVRAALDVRDPGVQRIVAEREGRLVGSVMLYPAAADAYGGLTAGASAPELRILAVAPDARGSGVGRALVEACIRRARESGATELGLHTSESMRIAADLYRRMGFVRAPEADFRPEGAELVEAYRLAL